MVRLPEDLIGVTSYADVLIEIARRIEMDEPASNLVALRAGSSADVEALIAEHLGERALVLVVENFSRLFSSIGEADQHSMRRFLTSDVRVVMLATAPLLTTAISDQASPWFGFVEPDYLDELTVAQGQELLVRLHQNDAELAAYLATPTARRRLEAIAQFVGGLPRLWIIAALCVTADSLAKLVPAVEDLLERLVPYYQERLWELSPLESKIVRTIAEEGRLSVGALAALIGEDQRSVATTLGRLEEMRWVRGTKPANRDRRRTFYELREPLVRHHLDYRSNDRQTLRLIVDVLREWFDHPTRLRSLGSRTLDDNVVAHLAASLAESAIRSDRAYASQSVNELLATARLWAQGEDADIGSVAVGNLISSIIEDLPEAQIAPVVAVGDALAAALPHVDDDDLPLLQLVEAGWRAAEDPAGGLQKLLTIQARSKSRQFQMQVNAEIAYWTGKTGDFERARALYTEVLDERIKALGRYHPDTLSTRYQIAHYSGQAGNIAEALRLYIEVLDERIEHIGADHASTLRTRYQVAHYTGATGDFKTALELSRELLAEQTRLLGPHHRDTLSTSHQVAQFTAQVGDLVTALDLSDALLVEQTEHLGPRHPDTFATRYQVARLTATTGDQRKALDLYSRLLADLRDSQPHDSPLARAVVADWTGVAIDLAMSDDSVLDRLPPELRRLLDHE